jgi:glucose/arabinose dehydrogenase
LARQSVCGDILAAWRANGLDLGDPGISEAESLALFGLPVSPAQVETLSDGNEYTVQWFERARFELHPENDPPYNVLLGLLGNTLTNNAPDGGEEPQPGETPELPPPPASTVWPSLQLVSPITGLTRPTHVTHAGDGSGRLFVVEQEGTIRVVRDGVLQATPFLNIRDRISSGGERGLLSVAFPPDYASKGYFYIDYTDTNGDSVVARYFVTENPDVADAGSEQVILFIEQPYANHNGGQLAFGPQDGYLYIGKGDGGSGGDPENRAQDLGTLLGKILRIDVESGVDPYAIPPDNPFVQNPDARGEIWAYGLRNPWRFSFDEATGDLYIADVGQDRVEEVNFQPVSSNGGENYGWRIMEGNECFQAETCDTSGLTMPVVTYPRKPPNCSVTGGLVYRGSAYPDMQGIYYYADYCSSQVWGLRRDSSGTWQNQPLIQAEFPITSFGEDEAGNLYMTDYFNGTIYRVAD